MTVSICVGSSCHLKGSQKIIGLMQEKVKSCGAADKIELKAAFCCGECANSGVTIKVDDEVIGGVSPENFDSIFDEKILKKLRG